MDRFCHYHGKLPLLALREKGDSMALMWNVNMTINAPEMVDFMAECGIVDLMAKFQEEGLERFSRGKERIDFLLGTHDLLLAKDKAGILNYDEGFPGSDHQMV
jgi:hypothetical protein